MTGVSPFEVKLPKSQTPVSVEVRHAGYQILHDSIVPDADHRLKLTLSVLPRGMANPPAASASAPPPTPVETAPPAPSSPYHRFD
jgi:hypothetical protein